MMYCSVGYRATPQSKGRYPFYGVPSVIAVNMILSGASGGITAIVIATWAQVGSSERLYYSCS